MQFLFLILSVLYLFHIEIALFLMSLTFIQWIVILSASSFCLFFIRRKIKDSATLFIRRIKNIDLKEYREELSKADANEMGILFAFWIERNIFIKLGCITLSAGFFLHYPTLLTEFRSATIFLLTLMVYPVVSIAFRREMRISMSILFFCIVCTPYLMAIFGHFSGENPFETLPVDIVYSQHIDISNLTQTANKLFLHSTVPIFGLMFLVLFVTSVFLRSFLRMVFTVFLKLKLFLIDSALFVLNLWKLIQSTTR